MSRYTLVKLMVLAMFTALPLLTWAGDADAEKMEAWARAMTPGEPHAELADQAGEWRYTVTFWEDPKGEPTVLRGVSLKTMIMGGRFLREELTGEFMGGPFKGYGLHGYDNVTGEYVAIWLDNMGTGIHFYTGQDTGKGVQTYKSEVHDPITGKAMATRSVGRTIDRDNHSFETYLTLPDGTEFLHMQVDYTRAGSH